MQLTKPVQPEGSHDWVTALATPNRLAAHCLPACAEALAMRIRAHDDTAVLALQLDDTVYRPVDRIELLK